MQIRTTAAPAIGRSMPGGVERQLGPLDPHPEERRPGPGRSRSRGGRPPVAWSRIILTIMPVGRPHRLERPELLEVFEREVVKRLPGDRRPDQEAEDRGDPEVDRDAGVLQVIVDRLPLETRRRSSPPGRSAVGSRRRRPWGRPLVGLGQDVGEDLPLLRDEALGPRVRRVDHRVRLERPRRLADPDHDGPVVVHLELGAEELPVVQAPARRPSGGGPGTASGAGCCRRSPRPACGGREASLRGSSGGAPTIDESSRPSRITDSITCLGVSRLLSILARAFPL